jgi:hypothetical protein
MLPLGSTVKRHHVVRRRSLMRRASLLDRGVVERLALVRELDESVLVGSQGVSYIGRRRYLE